MLPRAALFLCALMPVALAGDSIAPYTKLSRAAVVIEVHLPLEGTIPESWPNQGYAPQGWAFPDELVTAGRGKAEITRVVVGSAEVATVPEGFHVFGSGSPCWWLAHRRGGLRTLVFLEADGEGWRPVFGVEHEWGGYTDLHPGYDALVAALGRAGAWTDERAAAVDAAALWQDQRAALVGEDPFAMVLARDFLLAHDAAAVLDEAWGAAGTPERVGWEAQAVWPHDPGHCVAQLQAGG